MVHTCGAARASEISGGGVGSGKYDCTDSEKVCELYSAVILQVKKSEAEIGELKKVAQQDMYDVR